VCRAIVYVDKATSHPDAGKARLYCGRYDFPSGGRVVASYVHRPAQRVRPGSTPPSCPVVGGATIGADKHKRDACNFAHTVEACNSVRVHIAFFARGIALGELGGVEMVGHSFLNFQYNFSDSFFTLNSRVLALSDVYLVIELATIVVGVSISQTPFMSSEMWSNS